MRRISAIHDLGALAPGRSPRRASRDAIRPPGRKRHRYRERAVGVTLPVATVVQVASAFLLLDLDGGSHDDRLRAAATASQ